MWTAIERNDPNGLHVLKQDRHVIDGLDNLKRPLVPKELLVDAAGQGKDRRSARADDAPLAETSVFGPIRAPKLVCPGGQSSSRLPA